jgi:diacylglycerol kinase
MPRARTLAASFGYAFAGVAHAVRTQRNAQIHLAVAVCAFVAGIVTRLTWVEWAVLAVAMGSVFAAELINTALECLVDLVSPDYHERARAAKDTAAGAVLFTALAAVAVGVCLFGPPAWRWLGL